MKKWSVLILLSLAAFIMVIDSTAMNVSISYLVADLDTDLGTIQSIMSIYTLVMAVFMLPGAKIADIFGKKRVFKWGVLVYGVGTLTAALSVNSFMLFIGWAIIEGLASALMMPTALSLITSGYEGKERAVAMSIYTAMGSVALAIGPIFGGLITTYLSWRYVFALEVIIVVIIVIGFKTINAIDCEGPDKSARFDYIGTALLGLGLVCLIQGSLYSKEYGWFTAKKPFVLFGTELPLFGLSITIVLICIAAVFLLLFVLWLIRSKKQGKQALVDTEIFKSKLFDFVLVVNILVQISMMATMFVLPIYLQNIQGYNALSTGLTLVPLSVTLFVTAMLVVKVTNRVPVNIVVAFGALAIFCGGLYMNILFGSEQALSGVTGLMVSPAMILLGVGIGCTLSLTSNIGLSAVPAKHSNQASGTITTVNNLGSSLSTAVVGSMLISGIFTGVAKTLINAMPEKLSKYSVSDLSLAIENAVNKMQGAGGETVGALSPTPEQLENIKLVLISGMNDSMQGVFRLVMGIAAVACIVALVFLRPKANNK